MFPIITQLPPTLRCSLRGGSWQFSLCWALTNIGQTAVGRKISVNFINRSTEVKVIQNLFFKWTFLVFGCCECAGQFSSESRLGSLSKSNQIFASCPPFMGVEERDENVAPRWGLSRLSAARSQVRSTVCLRAAWSKNQIVFQSFLKFGIIFATVSCGFSKIFWEIFSTKFCEFKCFWYKMKNLHVFKMKNSGNIDHLNVK